MRIYGNTYVYVHLRRRFRIHAFIEQCSQEVVGQKSGNRMSTKVLTQECMCVPKNTHKFMVRQARQTQNFH
jgi:hypothetical protein